MKRDDSSSKAGLPTAAKTKKGRLLIVKDLKRVSVIASIFHDLQDIIFILFEIKLLDNLCDLSTIVFNYCY